MKQIEITLNKPVDCLCDFTYNFYWQHRGSKMEPDDIIPSQDGTGYTYRVLVETLLEGGDVRIAGDVGRRLASSMGVDLYYFGGTGGFVDAGNIFVEGDANSHMGISMCAGSIYVSGRVREPLGNLVEVASDVGGYRKFRSITDIIHRGQAGDELLEGNSFDGERFVLADGVLRNTLGARCARDVLVDVKGDVDLSAGIMMKSGTVHIRGDAGMNTGVLLRGGHVIVDGASGEFAGTEMKKGCIMVGGRIGSHIGSKMTGGVIYAKSGAKTIPPVAETVLGSDDVRLLTRVFKINPMVASGYKKYMVTGSSMQPIR